MQQALNRKTISQAYHTNVPAFLRSEGPFAIYDHSLRYVKATPEKPAPATVTDKTTLQALKRHEQDLAALKAKRESEKATFYHGISEERRLMAEAAANHKNNLRANQEFIAMQMAQAQEARAQQNAIDKQYYKPHFGPEETNDVVRQMNQENAFKKTFINEQLREQIDGERRDSEQAAREEKQLDREFLRVAIELQTAEEKSKKQKEVVAR